MADTNEFAQYTLEVLEGKKKRFRRLQLMMLIMTGSCIVIVSVAAAVKENMQVFQLVPFLIIAGVVFPFLIFSPIRKKIQLEIDSRGTA